MKQINLIPRSIEASRKPINPFWRSISLLTLVLLVGAMAARIYMNDAITFFYEFDEDSVALDVSIAREEELTAELTARENELKQTLNRLVLDASQQQLVNPEHMISLGELLIRIITPMPETLWLTSITCNYQEQSLLLTGRSSREGDLERYIQQGFQPSQGFRNPSRKFLRLNEETLFFEFAFEVEFLRQKPESIVGAQ